MNEPFATCTVAIIVLTSISSLMAFRDPVFQEKHLFSVREILTEKQYYRLFTGAFLHADWNHLLMNMISFYLFGRHIEYLFGPEKLLIIYFAAIAGGSILSLWIHRHHEYHAYGASGGVCGIIFSYIFLFPGSGISVFPLPVSVPAWLYAILYFVGSIWALKRQTDNIGHDAHLGGAIIGLWTTAVVEPWIVRGQPKLFLAISVLSVLLCVYIAQNPLFLSLSTFRPILPTSKGKPGEQPRHTRKTLQVDAILEKISESGFESLSEEEKVLLRSASEEYRRRARTKKSG